MTVQAPIRGGAPVGHLCDLDPVEARAVMCLRLWGTSSAAQIEVLAKLVSDLGPTRGRAFAESFGTLCEVCIRYGRRPFRLRPVDCPCLGADEACFATFIGYASEGAREDAFLLAATMIRPDMASTLVGLAEDVGLTLRRAAGLRSRGRPAAAALH